MLAIMFDIAKYLARGLKKVIIVPAQMRPRALNTRKTVPVIILAVDAVKRKWICKYLTW